MNAVSLFAGIEGIGLALERAGINVVAAVEIDPACRNIIGRHFPDVTLFDDVTKVTGDDLLAAGFVPDGGLIAAGWPCQDNSVAGRRKGMAGTRSSLWRHVVRLLAETRATWFLGENVPGLLSVNGGRDFAACCDDLAGVGMGFAWRVLDAQHFGVPQRRRRVFIVGRAGDRHAIGPVQVLFEPESGDGDSAAGGSAWPGTTAASDGGTVGTLQGGGRRGHRIDAEAAAGGHLVTAPTLTAGWGTNHGAPGYGGKDDAVFAVAEAFAGGKPGQGYPAVAYQVSSRSRLDREDTYIANALTASCMANWDDNTVAANQMVTHALTSEGADASEDGTGRGTPLVVAAPLTAGSATGPGVNRPGRRQEDDTNLVAAGAMVRRLTPLECERLQGFPDHWTAGQSDSARYRQLGNAVAVPVAEWIARRIKEHA